MAEISVYGSNLGTSLTMLLDADEIEPGAEPSYQLCKVILTSHPLGQKMAEAPISMAQSQARDIAIPAGPEDRLKKAFNDEWKAVQADKLIFNTKRLSRAYGVSTLALMPEKDADPDAPVDFEALWKIPKLKFNVFDPLNTAGSLVLSQQPNDPDFLKAPDGVRVNGKPYHSTRVSVVLNEEPIYLAYTSAGFGYVGRPVYQRALFPLKSFVQTMRTDDLVALKAGVIIAKMKAVGDIVTQTMKRLFGLKSEAVKQAKTYNVISISTEEDIETLNMQNLDGAYSLARTNILKNIATAADMPARLLENETMVSGFGEGTEDAKNVAMYVDRFRIEMEPLYGFMDHIVQRRAWSPELYAGIQADFPDEYGGMDFQTAFYRWQNSFAATWPSLLQEPESEKAKADDIKLKAIISTVEVLSVQLDQPNKANLIRWAQDNLNENKTMFTVPLDLDFDSLAEFVPPVASEKEPEEPRPFAAQDSVPANVRQLVRA
jgi:Protein of unknown function (DUF1073)